MSSLGESTFLALPVSIALSQLEDVDSKAFGVDL